MDRVSDENNAACNLEGQILNDRWKVIQKATKTESGTGGKFSVRYIVEDTRRGGQAFLKALDYKAFFSRDRSADILTVIEQQNAAFLYERSVLLKCNGKKLSKVIQLFDTGQLYLENFQYPTVPYLIFEMADGDIRSKITFSNNLDTAWKLLSLHDVAVGLQELHSIGVSHQDLKPSNVLLYERGLVSKIADLGSSFCSDIKAPHDDPSGRFTGDGDYAPIEFLYRSILPDVDMRRRATDMYLFGNLIAFYFTGFNMTSLILKNLNKQFHWTNWKGHYSTVRDYLLPAFYKALQEFKSSIPNNLAADDLCKMLEQCCFPYPEKRGHPRAHELKGNPHSFERYITKLDVLRMKVELDLIRNSGN